MNGKGDKARNNHTEKFRKNFDTIEWTKPKKPRTSKKPLSEMAVRALDRPANFEQLSGREQWDIDKRLGILDWDGS